MPVNRRPGSPNNFFADDEFGLADVGRLVKGMEREPAALREMRMRLEKAQTSISAINSVDPVSRQRPAFSKALLAAQKTEAALSPRIGLYEATRQERTSAQAVNSIGRELSDSSVNSYVSRNLNSMNNQSAGLAGATSTSYSELKKRQEGIRGEMGRVRQRALNSAENLYDEEGNIDQGSVRKMHKSQVRFKGLANELTTVSSSLDQAKREGKDPQSRLLALTKASQNASGVLGTNAIEEQMKSGTGLGALSPKDLKQKETDASIKLIKAMEELRNSFGKGEEVMEKFADKAEEAAKELEEVQEAQGMSGGGGKYDSAKIIAGTVAEALNIITTGFQNVAINQPMQMVSNVQGAANIENEKYNMWHSAVGGDMTARMSLGAWATGDQFGEQQAGRQGIVHGARMVTNTVGAVLGGVQMAEAVAGAAGEFLGSSRVEAGAQGAKSLVSGVVGDVEEGAAWYRQTEKARLRIDSTHAVVNAAKALNHIPGHQLQKYRDYAMGLNEAANQMGGQTGEAFLNETGGTDFMERMQTQGVGLKEMGTLSAQGAAAMGSMFKSSQVIDAAKLENIGFGSSDQNMHRMGTLGGAGTGDPSQNLAKIIEEGMQRGLDSSKAIDMMVENTARMTEETAKGGGYADPTDFLTKSILAAVDKNNPNKEMAGQIAYQTYQSEEGARHNIGTSFSGILNVDRNMKDLGMGTDRMSAALLSQIPTAMLNSYKDKSPEELKTFLEGRGINTGKMDQNLFKDGKIIDVLNKNASISELAQQSGVGYAMGSPAAFMDEILKNKDNKKVTNALIYGNDPNALSEEQQRLRRGIAGAYALQGKNAAAGIANAAVLAGVVTDKENETTLAEMDANGDTTRAAAQMEKRIGNVADVGAAKQGGKALGADKGGAEGIKALADTGRVAFEKAGKDAEVAWSTAASRTAQNFGKSSMMLDKASGKLDTAATRLMAGTDAMKVVSESFGAMMKKFVNDLTHKTDGNEHLSKLKNGRHH